MSPRPLRLFLDSADPDQWERWLPLGVFHGVTTNPFLLERVGQRCTPANLAALGDRAFASLVEAEEDLLVALHLRFGRLALWIRDPAGGTHEQDLTPAQAPGTLGDLQITVTAGLVTVTDGRSWRETVPVTEF